MFFKAKFGVNTWLRMHEIAFYVKIFPKKHVPGPYLNITKNKGILLTTTKNVFRHNVVPPIYLPVCLWFKLHCICSEMHENILNVVLMNVQLEKKS